MYVPLITLHTRLERYATASEPATRTPTAIRAGPSPINLTDSLNLGAGRDLVSPSNSDIKGLAIQNASQDSDAGISPLSEVTSPTRPSASYWAHDDPATSQPKMFPGIVHERTRRRSIRQGSRSEKDGNLSRSSSVERDESGRPAALIEEAAEDAE